MLAELEEPHRLFSEALAGLLMEGVHNAVREHGTARARATVDGVTYLLTLEVVDG